MRFAEFIRKERLYILLLIFVILVSVISAMPSERRVKVGEKARQDDLFSKRAEMEQKLTENRPLALLLSLTSLLILAILFLGIFIDATILSFKLAKNDVDIRTHKVEMVRWNVWDVVRVVILFLFFGYMAIIIESLCLGVFPILKNDNFRMMLNSSMLDILSVVFIIYFTVNQYKERLISLGLSAKNFLKNVFYGMVGYVATVPILAAVLLIILIIINITKYVPQRQPVVDLFLKEENAPFLIYTSLFAAIVGPFIEELFFRGFMYNAFKKYIGVFWAMCLTSAAFAALHTNLAGFMPIMVLGLLLAYLYEKTGTLVSSITVHMIHNLSMVYFVFLLKQLQG